MPETTRNELDAVFAAAEDIVWNAANDPRRGLCSAGLWKVDPGKDCPVCGARDDQHCFKVPSHA